MRLLAHPDTPGEWVWGIGAEVTFETAATLVCRYALHGDVARLRVPRARAGRRADGLWEHTCFEVYVAPATLTAYYEFNFSPSLDWAAYRFSAYRDGMAPARLARAPGLHARRTSDHLELSASVHLEGLRELAAARRLRLGLAAVVEDDAGALSYWALHHEPGNPDFHLPAAFALELEVP
ncbi:MAG TPA: DOMON-like domain-containing protein [Steroidobacteraceae bacterium]|nr:DOMON-like domain-containing protein [Steroidobacteraceae bacterium]